MKMKFLAITLLSCTALLGCSDEVEFETKIARVEVFQLPEPKNEVGRVFNGVAKAHDLAELSFRVDGKIAEIPVSKGALVKKGDLLAVLDKSDYEIALNDRRARKEQTYNQYRRGKSLLKQKLMPQSEYDKMRAEYLVAKAEFRMAELALEYTELRAPFDGIVGDVFLDAFENIQPGVSVLSMHKIDLIEVDVQVPDMILAVAIREEKRQGRRFFDVTFEAYPDITFEGRPLELNMTKDPVTHSYIATLAVDFDPEHKVLEGMPARVNVDLGDVTYTYSREYLVPVNAVLMQDGLSLDKQIANVWVYQSDSQTVTRREVRLGTLVGDMIEITAGLQDGEVIISDGASRLTEGQKVERIEG
ncbi:efflux RND transporter periplasmic adaptor subunit [Photobacterium sagamiensis]|uniref:efflux RND transporter periplasmic adaptor subunit n=1 Tax=Photobacterium sagamiensis TaxID=2910241 RepID=UPI003D14FF66